MGLIKQFFVPGAWLMRRMRLAGKLVLLMVLMVLALVAVQWGAVWVEVFILGALLYLMVAFYFSFMADLRRLMRFMEETAHGNLREKGAG
jgi:hypothetical protein